MQTTHPTAKTCHQSAEQIRSFVKKLETVYLLDRPGKSTDERRSAERMNVTMPVLVTPLDSDFQPLSFQAKAVTRDVSSVGAGLVMSDPIAPSFALLSFEPFWGDTFEVICKVAYCKDFGYYFRVGCEFFVPAQSDC